MPLGQHLGADQDTRATRPDFIQFVRQAAFSARAVAIDPGNANIRELPAQEILDPLRSLANRDQLLPALRAMSGHRAASVAMVAA